MNRYLLQAKKGTPAAIFEFACNENKRAEDGRLVISTLCTIEVSRDV